LKTINHTITYHELVFDELSDQEQCIVNKAVEISKNAYAPYSNYKVGVAAILNSGKIITGSNQENASYPLGLCAERVALFYIQSSFPNDFVKKIAITALSNNVQVDSPVFPCGACRQVLLEHELIHNNSIEYIFAGKNKLIRVFSTKDLMPLFFSLK